jgi:hypothetical protein
MCFIGLGPFVRVRSGDEQDEGCEIEIKETVSCYMCVLCDLVGG